MIKIKIYNNFLSEGIIIKNFYLYDYDINDIFYSFYIKNQKIKLIDIIDHLTEPRFYLTNFNRRILESNIGYIKMNNLLHKYIIIVNISNYDLNKILPYIDKEDMKLKVNNYSTFWHYLLNNFSNKNVLNFFKETLHYLDKDDLLTLMNNNGYNIFRNIDNEYKLEVIKLLPNYFNINDLMIGDKDNISYLHLLLNEIKSNYHLKAIEILLPYIEKDIPDILSIKDSKMNTFWHKLFFLINSNYKIEAIKSFLPYLKKNDLLLKDNFNKTCWHLLFDNKGSVFQFEIVNLLLQYLDKDVLIMKDYYNQTCWHKLLYKLPNEDQIKVIKLLLPYLDKNDLLLKDNSNKSY